ncbi:MAG TPA: TonB-dependent receptor [Azospirillaceae bacterium]|nr:TonB-dependent receptor [Azospirillaceae bacterium]
MGKHLAKGLLGATALVSLMAAPQALAQGTAGQADATAELEEIVVTGSRIPRADLTSTSPVSITSQEQIRLDRAVTVEDFSVKLPQLAGGVNNTSAGSDAYGAQTLDLRNFGQNRTLVLINGTRAVPFSFRNAVDVNAIPAALLKRVDILTGGAAAVYGADAVAGVVNFIIDNEFEGLEAGANYEHAEDGGSQYGGHVAAGGRIGDRGHVVGYLDYARRETLRAGDRPFALARPGLVPAAGGNFTDVASGRTFAFDDAGNFTLTPQTSNFTPQYILIQPMERYNASTFFEYDVLDGVTAYGRGMYTNVQTTGSSRSGSQPVAVNEVVNIRQDNRFLPDQARNLLTFVNGVAQVRVNRSLGELGIITADTERNTYQGQLGLRGPVTTDIGWDVYAQFGRTEEETTVNGDAIRNNADGTSRFAGIANTVDIFGPGADLAGFGQSFQRDIREREQFVTSAVLSGTSAGLFELPAGPLGFAAGYEYRDEKGTITHDAALGLGLSFRQGVELPVRGSFDTNEFYGELLVPVIRDVDFVKELNLEGAYRTSDYSNAGRFDTNKLASTWAVNDDIRFRGSRQKVIRAPNIGEFAAPTSSIPFSSLVTVARLAPRYAGDPCALGTGNAEQCRRFGAPAAGSYNSRDAANLRGNYFFGGNPDIGPESGITYTVGTAITPRFLDGFSATVDWYQIKLKDAVGQIQPIDALTSCYITNPVADNPLCAAVTRDPTTGFILNGFPIDRNLGVIKQRGFDVNASYRLDLPEAVPGETLTLQYQGNIVTDYTIQRNEVLQPVNCKGSYGFACSSDAVSLVAADYRHRVSLTWDVGMVTAQLGWQRIGDVRDSALGSTERIKAQDYFDAAVSVEAVEGVTLNVGVDNLLENKPPRPTNAGSFNTYPDTYNVIGRTIGVSLTIRQ